MSRYRVDDETGGWLGVSFNMFFIKIYFFNIFKLF